MNGILYKITQNKIAEVEATRRQKPLSQMIDLIESRNYHGASMSQSLRQSPFGIIAEFKRKSPSKGWLHEGASPLVTVPKYEQAGASACSILTDLNFFGGTLNDLMDVRNRVKLPLLRKEFIVDPYQLYEAKWAGADAILLIAACLSVHKCYALAQLARSLGLEVLLEVHEECELDHLNPFVDMLGVNNRNLDTFVTDVETSFFLADRMRQESDRFDTPPLLISESGLTDAATLIRLRKAGFEGFLMGETFMRHEDPACALQQLIEELR